MHHRTVRHPLFLPRSELDLLLSCLRNQGYLCHGPKVRDKALVYAEIGSAEELPVGWRDQQAPGEYRLQASGDERCFAWANGPQALKPLTFAPEEGLWRVTRDAAGALQFQAQEDEPPRLAVLGVKACDLAALAIQDRHFSKDARYRQRRERLLLIGVDCFHPAATCFCHSTGDGPILTTGYDIGMAELDGGYLMWAANALGQEILGCLGLAEATSDQRMEANRAGEAAARCQTRQLPSHDLSAVLFAELEHPAWEAVARRCLACGSCTLVCPTCYCHSLQAAPALDGTESVQLRLWDSCFNADHSIMHGHLVRPNIQLRYRQWLSHKLAGWHAQFGRSGCVGCGRCISWCPVGIDITGTVDKLLEGRL